MGLGHWQWVTHRPGSNPFPPGSLVQHPEPIVHGLVDTSQLTDSCPHCGQPVPPPLEEENTPEDK